MTDLPTTTVLPTVPTRRLAAVPKTAMPLQARRHSGGNSSRMSRARQRGWAWAVVLVTMDAIVAMFWVGLLLGELFPSDLGDRGSATRSPVPPPVAAPPVGGGVPVAVDAQSLGRQDGRDGGAVATAASTSTTVPTPVVSDAAPARGQTPQGPAGGPASTTTPAVASTVPSTAPPVPVAPSVPETVPEPPETSVPDTTPPPATTPTAETP